MGGAGLKEPSASEVWWLVVATQDGGPALTLPGWPPGCFLVASRARSQVIMLLEAWGDSELGGERGVTGCSQLPHLPRWPQEGALTALGTPTLWP